MRRPVALALAVHALMLAVAVALSPVTQARQPPAPGCEEDMPCWIGSSEDSRSDAQIAIEEGRFAWR